MVFQSYALYPHMSVRQNLAYGLKVRRTPKREIERRVDEVAQLLGLEELLDRSPAHLSGGQRQRVAMGRAIVREPQAFLMDEPLSNLDAKLRVGMRASLSQLHARLGVTTVYVTHDQVEAMTLGQRVAVMRDGRILQVDAPQTLYREPRDLFVAAFIGSPAMNLVEATIDGDEVGFGQFRVRSTPRPPASGGPARVVLGIRPECFEDAAFVADGLPTIEVHVEVLEEVGSDAYVFFRVDAPRITRGDPRGERRRRRSSRASSRCSQPASTRARPRASASRSRSRRPAAVPLLRSRDGREPARTAAPTRRRREPAAAGRMTKQSETREQVLDLIEQLSVGDAIPSERKLSTDLGVSRLTVRAALDELVREGYLVRRRGAGTFVSEPKIAQELTMTSFTEDMRQRGHEPGEPHARAPRRSRRRAPRAHPPRLTIGAGRRRDAPPARRPRDDGDRGAPRPPVARSRPQRARPRAAFVLRAAPGALRDRDRHRPADVEPTVTGEEESAALGVPLHSPAFVFERVTRSDTDEIVEYVRSVYRGDRYRLVTELRRGARGLASPIALAARNDDWSHTRP